MRIKAYLFGTDIENVIVCIILIYNLGLYFPIFLRKTTPNAFLDILNGLFFKYGIIF